MQSLADAEGGVVLEVITEIVALVVVVFPGVQGRT